MLDYILNLCTLSVVMLLTHVRLISIGIIIPDISSYENKLRFQSLAHVTPDFAETPEV